MQSIWIALIALALVASSALALGSGLIGTLAVVQDSAPTTMETDGGTQLAVDCYKLQAEYFDTEEDSAAEDAVFARIQERGCWKPLRP